MGGSVGKDGRKCAVSDCAGKCIYDKKKERRRRESRPGKEIYMKIRNVRLNLFDVQTTAMPGLSAEMKTFYENTLIDMAEPKLVHDRFADKYPIPRNGGKTIELRKYS